MIMLCKHCMDILGYDEVYTKRDINEDCKHCSNGLKREDVIFCDDLMVELLIKLNKDLGIKTHYSCIGHYVDGKTTSAYVIVDKNELSLHLFKELIVLNNTVGVIRKQSRNRMKVSFLPYKGYSNLMDHAQSRIDLIKSLHNNIDGITSRYEYNKIKEKMNTI